MRTILVIEDDDAVRENVLDLLKGEGYFALGEASGQRGLETVRQRLPDLIICDIMMPGLDGLDVLRLLQSDPETATIPFIFLTALTTPSDVRQGMNMGADDYLAKPFTADELLAAVHARLEKHEERGHWYQSRLQELRNNLSRNLPHELRTPLSSILGYSQFLMEISDDVDPAELRTMLDEIHEAGKRLERLFEKYHLYAQLEIGLTDPVRRTALINLSLAHADQIVPEAARRQAEQAGRVADLHLDVEAGEVRMQGQYIDKIVEELVDNAFKFSKPGAPVRVLGRVEAPNYRLTVQDQGRGIPEGRLGEVGAFVQFERDRYEQQGVGLGLALAQRLALLYQGSLEIESNPDQGITVQVVMPLAD